MVCMEDPEHLECPYNNRIYLIGFNRGIKHHIKKIGAIGEVCPGIDDLVTP